MIDVSKIRVGDEVTVRAKVVDRGNEFTPRGPFNPVVKIFVGEWVGAEHIEAHHPKHREFKPGDRVTWGNGAYSAEFIALRGDEAAVWESSYGWKTPKISDLHHADESE